MVVVWLSVGGLCVGVQVLVSAKCWLLWDRGSCYVF